MNLLRTLRTDLVMIAFPFLLILAGLALILVSNLGVLPLENIARFWPLAIVAAGLVELDPLRKEDR